MSPRKIIFIIITALLFLGIVIGAWKLNQTPTETKPVINGTLSIWIVGDTTEGYEGLIEGFHTYAPEYKNAKIEFKKFADYSSYQKILLSALAEQKGPDIFMVDASGDPLLQDKVELIPSEYINFQDFEKRYEDIFLPLIESSGTESVPTQLLRGVPLGYETLGIFYNKSLLIQVPKTWNDVSTFYINGLGPSTIYPTNIGMNPRYTPYASDIFSLFLLQNGINSYEGIDKNGLQSLESYLSYAETPITTNEDDTLTTGSRLSDEQDMMLRGKLTTLDLFIRGKIAFVVGYPSMISLIEDAKKRAGTEAIDSIVLTERIPQSSLNTSHVNLARYNYFGLSKSSQNGLFGVKFLEYLMTDDAQQRFIQAFPLYVPAQRSFYETSANTPLSRIFSRTKLESFIPSLGDTVLLFNAGNKQLFDKIIADNIDRSEKIDKNNIINLLKSEIQCDLGAYLTQVPGENCTNK